MAATVIVNNLTVVHKASGGTSIAAPDVCKTPTPGGPVPVPYANAALSRNTSRGSKQVRGDGHPLMLKSSQFSTSSGDDPGTLGGVISGKSRGKAYPRSYSFDVKIEGQPVFRYTDMMLQNSGSPGNAAGIESQVPNAAAASNVDRAEMVEMRWSKTQLCCGDPVQLAVKTRNADNGQVIHPVVVRDDLGPIFPMEAIPVELQGDKADAPWISRWRPGFHFKEKIPAYAAQGTLAGAFKSVNSVEFRNPPTMGTRRIGPYQRTAPEFEQDSETGEWIETGRSFAWDVCYDLELTRGQLFLYRRLDFKLGPGVAPVVPSTWRSWKRQIESVWDRKFFFHRINCARGSICDCGLVGCCKYPLRILALQGRGHGSVDLFDGAPLAVNRGSPDLWWYSHTWWTQFGEVDVYVRAHEFGHLIGCFDEYNEGACHPSRDFADVPGSVMNDGNTVFRRHVDEFHRWFVEHAGAVVGEVETVRI